MTGRSHAFIGLSAGMITASQAPADTLLRVIIIVTAVAGALLPDIDHPRAIAARYTPGVGHAARLFISHRGMTHTLLFVAVCVGLLFIVKAPLPIVAAAGAGLLSHLIADMATPSGIPLLMPLSNRPWRLAPRAILGAVSWLIGALALAVSLASIVWVMYLWSGL